MACFWLNDPRWDFDGVEIEQVELRDWTVYTVETAIFAYSSSLCDVSLWSGIL